MATKAVRSAKARITEVEELAGYITVILAAKEYNMTREAIGNFIQRGHIPAIRVGGKCLMIRKSDLDNFLQSRVTYS
jgi:excisionase family DNA binding protein